MYYSCGLAVLCYEYSTFNFTQHNVTFIYMQGTRSMFRNVKFPYRKYISLCYSKAVYMQFKNTFCFQNHHHNNVKYTLIGNESGKINNPGSKWTPCVLKGFYYVINFTEYHSFVLFVLLNCQNFPSQQQLNLQNPPVSVIMQ